MEARSNRQSTTCFPYCFRGENRITNLWILTPFLTLATFGLLVTPAGLIKRGKTPIGIAPYAGLTGLVIALGSTIWLGFYGGPSQIFGGFQIDLFTYFFTGVLLLVSLFVAISSLEFMKGDANTAPYFGLLLLSTLGMIVLAASMDLILLYVGWELMSIPTYALTAIKKKDPNSNEAAVKFFVLSALSSALLVYAISLTFG
ncbi:MAG TPA: proton-conducting transporter membrane subunit, partial [Candidatus Bathyarchaeia archaeon]|nr:proton-conducting transporter membrane subunit [Candidatus Bathyarchaeia archaeon]